MAPILLETYRCWNVCLISVNRLVDDWLSKPSEIALQIRSCVLYWRLTILSLLFSLNLTNFLNVVCVFVVIIWCKSLIGIPILVTYTLQTLYPVSHVISDWAVTQIKSLAWQLSQVNDQVRQVSFGLCWGKLQNDILLVNDCRLSSIFVVKTSAVWSLY